MQASWHVKPCGIHWCMILIPLPISSCQLCTLCVTTCATTTNRCPVNGGGSAHWWFGPLHYTFHYHQVCDCLNDSVAFPLVCSSHVATCGSECQHLVLFSYSPNLLIVNQWTLFPCWSICWGDSPFKTQSWPTVHRHSDNAEIWMKIQIIKGLPSASKYDR